MSWTDIPTWTVDASRTIMEAVRVKDEATYTHCVRVSRGARLLAWAAGLNEVEQKVAEFAGLFHDIGKVGVPESILNKPAKLTPEEYDIMKSHPEKSVQILAPLAHVEFFQQLLPGVQYHHEWFDGRGYPAGKKEDDIPLAARIILIADTFDAMTATRAYRKGLPAEVAYKELKDFSGTQFDPHLVKIYLDVHPRMADQQADLALFEEMGQTVLKAA